MSSRFARPRLLAVALVTAALAIPALALAAGGNSVTIEAPHKAMVEKHLTFRVKGTVSSPSDLGVFVNPKGVKCKSTYATEYGVGSGYGKHAVQRSFNEKFGFSRFPQSGTYYLCAYIFSPAIPPQNLAMASSKVVVKH